MDENSNSKGSAKAASVREDRLKAALKANLARRKAQARVRAQAPQANDQTPGETGQDKDE